MSRPEGCKNKNHKQICLKGHDTFITGRYKSGACKVCAKENGSKWKKEHPEQVKDYSYTYYNENIEKILAKDRKRYKENSEAVNKKNSKWAREHPARVNEITHKYQKNHPGKVAQTKIKNQTNRKLRIPKWLTSLDWKNINEFYDNCPKGYEVDHIIPLQGKKVFGFHVRENLQYLTPHENAIKHNSFDGTPENNGWRKKLNLN